MQATNGTGKRCPGCKSHFLIPTRSGNQLVCPGATCTYYEVLGEIPGGNTVEKVTPVPVAGPNSLADARAAISERKEAVAGSPANRPGDWSSPLGKKILKRERAALVMKQSPAAIAAAADRVTATGTPMTVAQTVTAEPINTNRETHVQKSKSKKPTATKTKKTTKTPALKPKTEPKQIKTEVKESNLTPVEQAMVALAAKRDEVTLADFLKRTLELNLITVPKKWHYSTDVKPESRKHWLASLLSRNGIRKLVSRGLLVKVRPGSYRLGMNGHAPKAKPVKAPKVKPTPARLDGPGAKVADPFAVGARVRLRADAPASFRKLATFEELDALVVSGKTGKSRIDVQAGGDGVRLCIDRAHLEVLP